MGKKVTSVGKAASKAAKQAKQEKLASRKAAKDDKKNAAATAASTGKGSKGEGKGGKGKKVQYSALEQEDLDALLKQFTEEWRAAHAVNEETVGGPPSRRANATLTPCPVSTDLWLFGGEYFDGDRASFYADMYRYIPPATLPTHSLASQEAIAPNSTANGGPSSSGGTWRLYSSPNQPGPRSAHQVVPDARQGGLLWLFGGEFASAKQTSFHHYRDLWVFSIASKTWERVDTKVRPSPRSGHRMALWRHYLVLFGGFIDTGARTTYLQDLWMFDTIAYKWVEIPQNDLKRPPARSGFSFLSVPEGLILHGGYCKRYVKDQRTQGVALEDTWLLKCTPQADGSLLPVNTPHGGKIEWEKRRKIGYAPGQRSGCTMVLWVSKGMGVLFGGVSDREDDDESMESVLFNELFGYNVAGSGRWISLNLRQKKKQNASRGKKKHEKPGAAADIAAAAKVAGIEAQENERQEKKPKADQQSSGSDGEKDNEENGAHSRSKQDIVREEGSRDKSAAYNLDKEGTSQSNTFKGPSQDHDPDDPEVTKPIPRFNAMLAIQRNTLYLYGGIHEIAEREYTLDDFYFLHLDKLERWVCLHDCKIEGLEWNESNEEDDSDSDGDDDDDSSSSSSEEGEQEGVEMASLHLNSGNEDSEEVEDLSPEQVERRRKKREVIKQRAKEAWGIVRVSVDVNGSGLQLTEEEKNRTPNPGETLRIFFDRTRVYWSKKAFELTQGEARGKEMRKKGFELAEQRYEEYKHVLRELEKIQVEAGLDPEEMRQGAQRAVHDILGGGAGVESRNRR